MQVFPCPFCGPRDEKEFHFMAEAGKLRPNTTTEISDTDWATYLHSHRNEKGDVREVWMHTTCAEVFVLERNSVSMDVIRSQALRGSKA